jgi:hypothetical protein
MNLVLFHPSSKSILKVVGEFVLQKDGNYGSIGRGETNRG